MFELHLGSEMYMIVKSQKRKRKENYVSIAAGGSIVHIGQEKKNSCSWMLLNCK
jgi:hypothetical protein